MLPAEADPAQISGSRNQYCNQNGRCRLITLCNCTIRGLYKKLETVIFVSNVSVCSVSISHCASTSSVISNCCGRHNSDMKESMEIILKSTITCPNCGHKKEETMPTDACQYFYECENCKTVLKPLKGDCCVYCSYGSVPCPSIQQNKKCC